MHPPTDLSKDIRETKYSGNLPRWLWIKRPSWNLTSMLPSAKHSSWERNRDERTAGGQNKSFHWETERHLLIHPPNGSFHHVDALLSYWGKQQWRYLRSIRDQVGLQDSNKHWWVKVKLYYLQRGYNSISPTTTEYFKRHYLIHLLSALWSKCPIFYFYFINGKTRAESSYVPLPRVNQSLEELK